MSETKAVMFLSNRKEKRVVLYPDGVEAMNAGRAFLAAGKWKRIVIHTLTDSEGPGHGVAGRITMTPHTRLDRERIALIERAEVAHV